MLPIPWADDRGGVPAYSPASVTARRPALHVSAAPPLVSILIPVYNHPDFLDDCLSSILVQDYKNLQVVIRDNFSDDAEGVMAVVRKYEQLFGLGEDFKYVRNERNVGYVQNKHDGVVSDCTGKYCLIMDHDDFFTSDKVIGLYVKSFELSDEVAVISSGVEVYDQENSALSPKEIIEKGVCHSILLDRTLIDGNQYFLNFWSKFSPLQPAVTMFDRQLALKRNWPNVECNDQSIPLLLAPGNDVVLFRDKFAVYRQHSSSVTRSVNARMCFASHTAIAHWVDSARKHSRMPTLSLFVWRLKTVILKDTGPIRLLHDQSHAELNEFLALVKKHSLLNYLILRYFNPQIIQYDAPMNGANFVERVLGRTNIQSRRIASRFILWIDRVLHDPEYRWHVPHKITGLLPQAGKPS